MDKVRALPKIVCKNNLVLRQVRRDDKLALYSVHISKKDMNPVGYEIFEIRVAPEKTFTMAGKTIFSSAHEMFPNNGDFGVWALSWATIEQANRSWGQPCGQELHVAPTQNDISVKA